MIPTKRHPKWGYSITHQRWAFKGEDLPWWADVVWQKLGCLLFGHEPIRDQCNIPEHDYCAWCQKSMPEQARWIGEQ